MELRFERGERVVGNIYKGLVQNVLPGMDAAFVNIGLERNAFLYVGDILPEGSDADEPTPTPKRSELRKRNIGELLKVGQEILVQVVKAPRGTKGARVTTRITLPGRYVVLMPEGGGLGVSKMNFGGVGAKMLRAMMRQQGVPQPEAMAQMARDLGVRIVACQMSMDVMGIHKEELVDGVEVGGVATFLGDATRSKTTLFI